MIKFATFSEDLNIPARVVYKRQKQQTIKRSEDDYYDEEEDEQVYDFDQGQAKDPTKILNFRPTRKKQFEVIEEKNIHIHILADRLFEL